MKTKTLIIASSIAGLIVLVGNVVAQEIETLTPTEIESITEQGKQGFVYGNANPYLADSPHYRAWEEGYRLGEENADEAMGSLEE